MKLSEDDSSEVLSLLDEIEYEVADLAKQADYLKDKIDDLTNLITE